MIALLSMAEPPTKINFYPIANHKQVSSAHREKKRKLQAMKFMPFTISIFDFSDSFSRLICPAENSSIVFSTGSFLLQLSNAFFRISPDQGLQMLQVIKCFLRINFSAAVPVTASIRRTPAATAL
jgi:hypothetical protein